MRKAKYILITLSIFFLVAVSVNITQADNSKLAQNISCKEAHEMIQNESNVVIIDVRTQPEFQFIGYIEGAYNIPYWFMSEKFTPKGKKFEFSSGEIKEAPMSRYQFIKNPDFLAYVKKVAKPTDHVLVYCGSSKRSAMAADDLVKAGYENVYNILKGYSKGWTKKKLPCKKMFDVKTIDPKYVYPPDLAK